MNRMECRNPKCLLEIKNDDQIDKKGLCDNCFYKMANCKRCNVEMCNNNYSNCKKIRDFIKKLNKQKTIKQFI